MSIAAAGSRAHRSGSILLISLILGIAWIGGCSGTPTAATTVTAIDAASPEYPVLSVADGDTITVDIDGVKERVRLIGIDAPELHPAECFGQESADYAAGLLAGKRVQLLRDDSQDDRDRYGRLLRYVFLSGEVNVNQTLVKQGFAREYTYDNPYLYQEAFRRADADAHAAGVGLWSSSRCAGRTSSGTSPTTTSTVETAPSGCLIKGNINSKGDKIFHSPGENSYAETVITQSKGERYFCSPADAEAAGWRPAKN